MRLLDLLDAVRRRRLGERERPGRLARRARGLVRLAGHNLGDLDLTGLARALGIAHGVRLRVGVAGALLQLRHQAQLGAHAAAVRFDVLVVRVPARAALRRLQRLADDVVRLRGAAVDRLELRVRRRPGHARAVTDLGLRGVAGEVVERDDPGAHHDHTDDVDADAGEHTTLLRLVRRRGR